MVVLTFLSAELGVRALYKAPAPMLDKTAAYKAQPHGQAPELLIFGTCLPEQIIQTQALGEQLGLSVSNLATPAGTARLFYLVLKHHIPQSAQIQAIVLPFGTRDLSKEMAPHESQVMALAPWSELPNLMRWACPNNSSCASELLMRKASYAYRNRGYIANKVWTSMGVREPIPGYVLSPGAIAPPQDGAAPPPPPLPPPPIGDIEPDLDGVPDLEFQYLYRFLLLAKARDIPVMLVPLPSRSDFETKRVPDSTQADYQDRLQATIQAGGGTLLRVQDIPGLSAQDFTDDVHLSPLGRDKVTAALGSAMSGS
ncbi:MAG: hypothetical protein ACI9VR_001935 [Cognaticolwellia sp.]